jgi:hypothetical protein
LGCSWLIRRTHFADLNRSLDVEQGQLLGGQLIQQALRVGFGQSKANFDRQVACQFKEVVLVQLTMATVSGNGSKGSPTVDADRLRLLQQPLVGEDSVVLVALLHEKLEVNALHV